MYVLGCVLVFLVIVNKCVSVMYLCVLVCVSVCFSVCFSVYVLVCMC